MKENKGPDEVYSKRVKAGKRVYFFDVKPTRSNDYYLTITESKKKPQEDGLYYQRYKIFVYKEDLNKFLRAINEVGTYIKQELMPDYDFSQFDNTDRENHADY